MAPKGWPHSTKPQCLSHHTQKRYAAAEPASSQHTCVHLHSTTQSFAERRPCPNPPTQAQAAPGRARTHITHMCRALQRVHQLDRCSGYKAPSGEAKHYEISIAPAPCKATALAAQACGIFCGPINLVGSLFHTPLLPTQSRLPDSAPDAVSVRVCREAGWRQKQSTYCTRCSCKACLHLLRCVCLCAAQHMGVHSHTRVCVARPRCMLMHCAATTITMQPSSQQHTHTHTHTTPSQPASCIRHIQYLLSKELGKQPLRHHHLLHYYCKEPV